MVIKTKPVSSGLLYQNKQHFALIDPTGSAVQLGTEERCVAEFYTRRIGPIILNDSDYDRARKLMSVSGWQVIPVTFGVFTQDVDLRKLKAG